ncbi:hypothetical protein MHYP_G00152470 [Metynnis hypsauchen]
MGGESGPSSRQSEANCVLWTPVHSGSITKLSRRNCVRFRHDLPHSAVDTETHQHEEECHPHTKAVKES